VEKRDIIVIGASAGGVEALKQIAAELPADFPGSVFAVVHFPPYGTSFLPEILGRAGKLPALHPEDGETIRPGTIYVGPPDRHLLLEQGRVCLSRGPRENGHRPAVDPLFRSAARWYGAG
jgi:two-component system chemotaxis response regulator CheB